MKRIIRLEIEILSDRDTSDMPPYEFLRIAAKETKDGKKHGEGIFLHSSILG
jgi:hypothetical protein